MPAHPHVLIIGGGIAGPALALFLKKAGIAATLHEAYPRCADIGGGLQVAPNGMAVLEQRLVRLDATIAGSRAELAKAAAAGLPALFLVEHDYELAMLETERRFVADLAARIRDGSLDGLAFWRGWHAEREARP